jgi:hypothetical protein
MVVEAVSSPGTLTFIVGTYVPAGLRPVFSSR